MTLARRTRTLLGRDAELGVLDDLVRGVAAGRGGAAWIEGEAGIGKSTLLAECLFSAVELGCTVLRGSADELGRRLPLRALQDCLQIGPATTDPARLEVVAALRLGAGMGAADPVPAAVEAVTALVDQLCRDPLVLALDDLHWADDVSLLVWQRLGRRVGQLPLLLIGTHRPVPRQGELGRLRQRAVAAGAVPVRLGPLATDAVTGLVTELAGARSVGPNLLRAVTRAAGNPLYVTEMVDALAREREVVVEAGTVELVGDDSDARMPASLLSAISDRLDFVPAPVLALLRSAALLGGELSVTDLASLSGRPATELAPMVDEAIRAGVLVESGSRLAFRHALIREVLYGGTPEALRIALHRQAARILAGAGAPVEQVARQLLAAFPTGTGAGGGVESWVLDWLLGPGAALAGRLPSVAGELLTLAVREVAADDPRREELETRLTRVLVALGRMEEAVRLARDVRATTADGTRFAEATWTLVWALYGLGRWGEVRDAIDEALRRPDAGVWTLRLRVWRPLGELVAGDRQQERPARAALAEAERAGDRIAIATGSNILCGAVLATGDVAAAEAVLARALRILDDDPQTADLRMLLLQNRMALLGTLDRLDEAEVVARGLLPFAERYGSPQRLASVRAAVAEHCYQAGRWDEAGAVLETLTDEPPSILIHRFLQRGLSALLAAHRDDGDRAATELADVADLEVRDGPTASHAQYEVLARAVLAERAGEPARARDLLTGMLVSGGVADLSEYWLWLPLLVRLAVDTGDPVTASAAAAAADGPGDSRAAARTHCRGLLDGDPAALAEAADGFGRTGRRLERAAALEDCAVARHAAGDRTGARAAVTEALATYAALGADWDRRRLESRLPAHAERRRPSRRRATVGWEALTATELTVAGLVAEGHSNPDVATRLGLSRRTIDVHVSHILAKLQVRSRVEIAREAFRRSAG